MRSVGKRLAMDAARLEVDLHLLELRFAGARLIEPQAVEKLARSIERDGQIVPCVVVRASPDVSDAKDDERLVLIDGYRRVAALRRLGRDRAFVERWPCDLAEALLGMLARAQNRSFAAIEEALLLRELTQGLEYPSGRLGAVAGVTTAGSTGGCNCSRRSLRRALPRCAPAGCRLGQRRW